MSDEVPDLVSEFATRSDDEAPDLVCDDMSEDNQPKKRVPVTIITGFLGAGKTTLLNYVMTENHGKRIAVIQNEFGAQTGIEEAMVMGQDGTQAMEWLELPNGCICCSVRSDLVMAVEYLVNRSESFDYVLVETDGLARPGPVAAAFWVDDELESHLYLDGIVTVVDAKNILRSLNEVKDVNEAQQQIAISDCILINKKDLVSEEELSAVESKIHSINDFAVTHKTCKSSIDLEYILDIKAYDQEKALSVDAELKKIITQKKQPEQATSCSEEHEHSMECGTSHVSDITSICLTSEQPLDKQKITQWLAKVLWEKDSTWEILRMKGVLSIGNEVAKYSLQGVHDIFDISKTNIEWQAKESRTTKLVIIGKNLNEQTAQEQFNACKV